MRGDVGGGGGRAFARGLNKSCVAALNGEIRLYLPYTAIGGAALRHILVVCETTRLLLVRYVRLVLL